MMIVPMMIPMTPCIRVLYMFKKANERFREKQWACVWVNERMSESAWKRECHLVWWRKQNRTLRIFWWTYMKFILYSLHSHTTHMSLINWNTKKNSIEKPIWLFLFFLIQKIRHQLHQASEEYPLFQITSRLWPVLLAFKTRLAEKSIGIHCAPNSFIQLKYMLNVKRCKMHNIYCVQPVWKVLELIDYILLLVSRRNIGRQHLICTHRSTALLCQPKTFPRKNNNNNEIVRNNRSSSTRELYTHIDTL